MKIWPVHLAVFLTSLAGILYEVSLTRFFAVTLWYHFVFLVISISILGLGIGAGLLHITALKTRLAERGPVELARYSLLFGVAAPTSIVLALAYPFANAILAYSAIVMVPFIFAGLFSASAFQHYGAHAQKLYFCDLVGAGLGSLLIIPVLSWMGAINAAIFVGAIPLLASLVVYMRENDSAGKWLSLTCLTVVLALGLANAQLDFLAIEFGRSHQQGKSMFNLLHNEQNQIVFSRWTSFARTDVVEGTDDRAKWIFTDGGAGSSMIRFDGTPSSVEYLKEDISYFPFSWGTTEKVLILGSGGGRDVLLALLGGSSEITAVEINPAIVEAVRRFGDYNGHLYDRDDVRVVVGDGRNFVERESDRYDLIYLPLVFTQSAENVGFALAENYVFTVEAFGSYLERLEPNGRVAFLLHDSIDLMKAMTMAYQTLMERGLSASEAARRMVIAYSPQAEHAHSDVMYPILIIRNEPFSVDEVDGINSALERMGLVGIHIPGARYPGSVAPLIRAEQSLDEFVKTIPFNVTPATDDSPFFYNASVGIPPSLKALLGVVGLATLFSVGYVHFHSTRSSKSVTGRNRTWWMIGSFFGLGVGYMLIEIALIQKLVLIFGNPTTSFSGVLFILLISSGLGSLFGSRFEKGHLPVLVGSSALVVAAIAGVYFSQLNNFVQSLIGAAFANQVLGVALLTAPLGFAMGIPFSSSLRLLREYSPDLVALAWGINGVSSVLGSALAVALAMSMGFSSAIAVGSVCYLVVALSSISLFSGKSSDTTVELP